jgi:hypothetical protein
MYPWKLSAEVESQWKDLELNSALPFSAQFEHVMRLVVESCRKGSARQAFDHDLTSADNLQGYIHIDFEWWVNRTLNVEPWLRPNALITTRF